jgi:hypothetical protein
MSARDLMLDETALARATQHDTFVRHPCCGRLFGLQPFEVARAAGISEIRPKNALESALCQDGCDRETLVETNPLAANKAAPIVLGDV